MRKLMIALTIAAFASCTKTKNLTPDVIRDYRCIVFDSSVYAHRPCANSTHFDTINLFAMDYHASVFYYPGRTQKEINVIVADFKHTDTANSVNLNWLFCGNAIVGHLDTIYDYQKLSCSY